MTKTFPEIAEEPDYCVYFSSNSGSINMLLLTDEDMN